MKNLSLRFRLAIFGAVAIAISLLVVGYGLSRLFGEHVERRAIAEMEIQLEQVLAGLSKGTQGLILNTPLTDPRFTRPYGGRYWQVVTPADTLRSRSLWDASLFAFEGDIATGDRHIFRLRGPDGEPLLGLMRVVQLPPSLGGSQAVVSIAMDATELTSDQRAFTADLAPYLLFLGVILIFAQIAQLSYGLNPLRKIGDHVRQLRAGRAIRMGDDWPEEVRPLASEIDGLLAARDSDIERARYRAGDLAHGLKTPLQALLGEANRLRQRGEEQPAEAIEDVVGSMQRHVDRELARARRMATGRNARTNVALVVAQIVDVLRRTPHGEAIHWDVEVAHDLHVALDASELAEAVGALVENAVRHASGKVQISARFEDGMICLEIRDDGPGIPADQLEHVLRRGARLDESSTGTGLGLSIAYEIAEAAGGTLEIANQPSGCLAMLRLSETGPG